MKFNRHRIPKIYDLFSKVGISVLICATVPFEDLSEYYKGKIIDNIIRMVLSSEKLWKECIEEYCFEIQIDANLERTNIEKILILDLKEQ